MDNGTLVLIGIGLVAIVLLLPVLDLIFAGGAMTMGTMHGMALMASNPIGQAIRRVRLAILGVLVYAVFFPRKEVIDDGKRRRVRHASG